MAIDPYYVILAIGLAADVVGGTILWRKAKLSAGMRHVLKELYRKIRAATTKERFELIVREEDFEPPQTSRELLLEPADRAPTEATWMKVLVALVGTIGRDIQTEEQVLPTALARRLDDFPTEFYGASLEGKKAAWATLRREVQPHLPPGREMAALQTFSFHNMQGEKVTGQLITPKLMERYRALERRCGKPLDEESLREAYRELLSLSAAWQQETGHKLSVYTSHAFRKAFTRKIPLLRMVLTVLRAEGLKS